jgi:hypothetical protein
MGWLTPFGTKGKWTKKILVHFTAASRRNQPNKLQKYFKRFYDIIKSSPIEYIKNQKNKKKENKLKGCKSNRRLCHVPNITSAVVMLQRSPFSKEI